SSTSSVRAVPWASIEQPPIGCSLNSNSPSASSRRRAAPTISGPIPSPGRRTMRGVLIMAALYVCGSRADAGLDVEADIVEGEGPVRALDDRFGEGAAHRLRQSRQVRAER